jgi:sarcosine oxidase subunit alpha
MRIMEHPILGRLADGNEVSFAFNGKEYPGLEGEPIAAALLANGIRIIRYTERTGEPRGLYCGIGHCYECRIDVNGVRSVRACITPLETNMVITSQGSVANED